MAWLSKSMVAKSITINQQMALAIQLNDEATFADFNWGTNTLLRQQLEHILSFNGDRILYLWGAPGSGKSHLLQACCQEVNSAMYLPLSLLKEWGPQAIEDLEEQTLLCIDDVDAIAQDAAWEEALFHLYNRVKDKENGLLIITGKQPPAQLPLKLPDLRSRLAWGLVLQLHELNDEEKINTLQLHASKRGFALPEIVGQFLINRCSRNMQDLHQLLNKLDEASLAAQRRITIPFVKTILSL